MPGIYALRHQPLRSIYLVLDYTVTLVVRLPIWVLLAIPPSLRPRRSWSIKRVLMNRILQRYGPFSPLSARIGSALGPPFATHHAIPDVPGVKSLWVEPAPAHLILGKVKSCAEAANVHPAAIPGYWIDKPGCDTPIGAPPQPGEKVIYSNHGGAYITLSGHPNDMITATAHGLIKAAPPNVKRLFRIEYRLSQGPPFTKHDPEIKPEGEDSNEGNPFPAALLDSLAGYLYLVNVVGFSPADIIVEGDSAGANLALALTRYLVDNRPIIEVESSDTREILPRAPGHLLLLSPWADLGTSHLPQPAGPIPLEQSSVALNTPSDFLVNLSESVFLYARQAFTGPLGLASANSDVYISPASRNIDQEGLFKGFPRTFILAGGAEMLLDSIRTLKEKMVADIGLEADVSPEGKQVEGDGAGLKKGGVTYLEMPDALHDWLAFPWHEPERSQASEAVSKWLA